MLGGQLIYFFGLTVLITVIVSGFVVWRYSASVLGGMRMTSGVEIALPAPAAAGIATARAASFDDWGRTVQRRVVSCWLAINLLAALPLALVYLWVSGELARATQVVAVTAAIGLAAVPVIIVSLGWGLLRGMRFLLLYLLAGMVLVGLFSVAAALLSGRPPSLTHFFNALRFLQLAAVLALLPALLMLLGWPSRIRYVVPIVFGSLVLFAVAPFVGSQLFQLLFRSDAGMQLLQRYGFGLRHAVFAALALPFAALVAWRLHRLGAAYAEKRFSDLQLLARTWWLMFACGQVITLVNAKEVPWWGGPLCAAAALLYLPISAAVLRSMPWDRGAPPARTLLFLRAFGWRARTERLFDRVGARWRYRGPITMIAAPDVVARSIDPADLLGYVRGDVEQSFVRSEAELDARLAAIDQRRDPDGRFRINEFCCADNTWRATVVRLMERADVVLMDLRGVRQGNKAGCEFELEQLALRLPPQRIVLVIDGETEVTALQRALGPAAAAAVHLHRFDSRSERAFDALVAEVTAAAG